MSNGSGESGTFDVVVLGGGSGGYATALRAAQLNLSVALIEKDKLGGTCLHRGCIPTKALLHAGEIADQTRESEQFGIKAELVGVDMAGVNAYKDGVVARLYKGLQGLVGAAKITYVAGHRPAGRPDHGRGRRPALHRPQRRARHRVVLARRLPGLELDGERVITSEHALLLDRVPASAIVLGGGVIGVEFASAWRSFGADVTIVEALPRLVAGRGRGVLEGARARVPQARHRLQGRQGVREGRAHRLRRQGDHRRRRDDRGRAAAGRGRPRARSRPNLGYEEQGLTMDRGFVPTDERLRTNLPNVYAVGDIVPGLQLAHRGFQQGIFVAEEIAGLNPAPIDETGIPRVTYCDPEVASMGLTEAKAKEQYGADKVKTYSYNLGGNGKSQILKTAGFVKLVSVVDGPVVGVHMVGARVGELVGEAQLIYNWEAYPAEVAQLVHAHPTQTEALGEAHLALAGKPLHAHA